MSFGFYLRSSTTVGLSDILAPLPPESVGSIPARPLTRKPDARRSIETWRVHYNMVRPHSSLGFLSPEQFRMAGETGCGKAGRSATLENSQSFPLSPSHDGGDNFPNSSLSTWT